MQKENKKKIPIVIAILAIVLVCMIGYAFMLRTQGHSDPNEHITEKIKEEITYLDANIVGILNSLNNIIYEYYKVQTQQISDSQTSSQTQSEQAGQQEQGQGQEKQTQNSSMSEETQGQDSGKTQEKQGKQQGSQNQNVTQRSKMEEAGVMNTDRKQIDWGSIKQQIEILYASWNTIALDLHSVNMQQDTILQFNTIMQQVIQAIKAEDKEKTMNTLSVLYALLPQYSQGSGQESSMNDIYKTKSEIIQAYGILEQQQWEDMANHIIAAQQHFIAQMNQTDKTAIQQASTNKIYMILKEMETVCRLEDTEMFLMNYKEVLQQIQMLAHE